MKLFLLPAVTLVLLIQACGPSAKNKPVANAVPACIQQKIDSIQSLPRFNPPAKVDEYLWKGSKVYLFSADCCDQPSPLYDSACNYLCAPVGGFTGKGDMRCPDFSNATHLRVVWKDKR